MVFSSLPLYLDPPNWQQHQHPYDHHHEQQLQGNHNNTPNENHHLHLIIPPQQVQQQPPPQVQPHQVGHGGAQIRPNSMAERARLTKIAPPETPLKCPRCGSNNTKFCYYNNYSLTQPRHFCKACRRYWTRNGNLRNVPVGGGCRRNKRSSTKSSGGATSSSSSKSSLSSPTATAVGGGHMDIISSTVLGPSVSGGGGMTSFMASLQNIANMGMGHLGLTYGGGIHAPMGMGGGIAGLNGIGGSNHHQPEHQQQQLPDFSANCSDHLMMSQHQHQHQQAHHQAQFPNNLLGGLDVGVSSSLYPGVNGGGDEDEDDHHHHHQVKDVNVIPNKSCSSTMMMMSELASVKMEDEGQRFNLAKQLMMGMSSSSSDNNATGNSWGGQIPIANTTGVTTNMWKDLSGL